MINFRQLCSLAVIYHSVVNAALWAQDAMEDAARRGYELPLRWDNIERSPQWVSGIAPERRKLNANHSVTLKPGDYTCVRVPACEWLRIVSRDGKISSQDLEVSLSNGSGLLATIDPAVEPNRESLFFDPQNANPLLAYVYRPAESQNAIRVSLFTSRQEPLQDVVKYRNLIQLSPERRVRLEFSKDIDSLQFWKWNQGDGVQLQLRGPARYKLEARFRYPDRETAVAQGFHISVADIDSGGENIANMEFLSSLESSHLVLEDGIARLVGRLEQGYFELPADRDYSVALKSTGPVYLRLLEMEKSGFLIPRLNRPHIPGDRLSANPFQGTPWELPVPWVHQALTDPGAENPADIERIAFRLARDNSISDGGMAASALLRNAGWHRRDYPELRERWRDFSTFTFYRDALPETASQGFTTAYFPNRNLRELGREQDWSILSASLIDPSLKFLQDGVFSPVPPVRSRVYRLPERQTAGRLRIVARRDREQTAQFDLRIEGQPSKTFRLLPGNDSDVSQTRPSLAETGLHFSQLRTLEKFRQPAETVSAGVYEFIVPPEVRRVELSNASGAENLPVAVQYRTSKPFALSEEQYISSVEGNDDIFRWCMECISRKDAAIPTGSRSKKELFNHWEPLRRYIQSRFLQFTESVTSHAMPEHSIETLDRLDIEGEFFLAERLARNLYLHSGDKSIKRRAIEYLDTLAIRKQDRDLIILNTCTELVSTLEVEPAAKLANLLRESGDTDIALMLALAIPDRNTAGEVMLASAFQQEWWLHFDSALAEAPDKLHSRVWKGIRLWDCGDLDSAIEEWSRAGVLGEAWIAHVDATARARDKVEKGDPVGIYEWIIAELNSPSPQIWRPVSHDHVAVSPQARTLKGVESGKYQQVFVATPDAPVEYIFSKPGLLRVECRPIHPAGSQSPVEGWITIETHRGLISKIPVISNFPTPGLDVVGHRNESPGTKLHETVALQGWNSRMKISADFGPVLVRVSRLEPETSIGHLPEMNVKTAAWLFSGKERSLPETNPDFGGAALIGHDDKVSWHRLSSPFCAPSDSDQAKLKNVFEKLRPVPLALPDPERIKSTRKMREWLTGVQSGEPRRTAEAIASGSAEWAKHGDFPELKSLHSAIVRRTYWEPLLATDQNAGFREIETEGWEPESPALQTRMLFLPAPGPTGQLVAGNDSTVASLTNREANRLSVSLSRDTIPFLQGNPVHTLIEVENRQPIEVKLDDENWTETLHYDLPRGRTSVKVTVTQNDVNQYLRVGFDAEKNRETLIRKTIRNWFVAYREAPLSIKIDGPAWVRIDQLTERGVESDYRHVVAEVENLTLVPEEGEALYRVHILRHDPNKRYIPPSFFERSVNGVRAPQITQAFQSAPVAVALQDDHNLHGQEDGTWTAGFGYQRRRIIDEVDQREADSFGQADLTYRYYDEDRQTWFRTTVLGRGRETGATTFGLERSACYTPFNSPLTYSFNGSLYEQDGEMSLSGSGRVSATGDLAPKWRHTSSATVFGRILSLDDAGARPEAIDRDIYSDYKSNHGIGLRFGEMVSYSPWQDTRLYAGAGLATNENIVTPDYISYKIGMEQLIGHVRLNANLTGYRFFDDADRAGGISRHRFNLEATGEFWTRNQHRFEAGLRWSHYFEEDDNAVSVFGRWHFGEGRFYRDFRPGEESFSDLRELQIPRQKNNRIHPHHEEESKQGN